MQAALFNIIGEPTRLKILNALQVRDLAVGDLVSTLNTTQPTVSKHLKVLRDAGFVSCHVDAQRRIYRLNNEPLREIDDWLEPYRQRWQNSLDKLEDFLDAEVKQEK
ncbi:MAG: metalloregulator ArsR/SmtB family transcription factor [Pseudomonadales bacterium]|nr:metalloregulator ArsR/SmtB family transcription factor [Pseudomonadales bacterium]